MGENGENMDGNGREFLSRFAWGFLAEERPIADTGGGRDGGQGCGDGGHNDLQDQFPDVLVFHGILNFELKWELNKELKWELCALRRKLSQQSWQDDSLGCWQPVW